VLVIASPLLVFLAGVFGAMLGSFLNVCVFRLPLNRSVVRPRSHCPSCEASIAWYDNIPLISWLALRARCRRCGAPISIRYPLVELAVAVIWALCVQLLGPTPSALAAALFLTILLGITLTDADHMIIPDEFSLGGLGAGLALSLVPGGISPLHSLLGAALGYGLLWLAAELGKRWAGRDAMGGGDLKMMAMVGSFLGWRGVVATVFLGSLVGAIVHLPSLLRRERHKEVPFGVFLAIGAAASLLAGDRLAAWYASSVLGR
jgi:leader peptidase (prepilin peptidase)/N-methyltransferase